MQHWNPYACSPVSVSAGAALQAEANPKQRTALRQGMKQPWWKEPSTWMKKAEQVWWLEQWMDGHGPVITNLVYSTQTGLGPGQKVKCVDWRQNQGGMNNHTCSMTQAQNYDDSPSLHPCPENKGKTPQSSFSYISSKPLMYHSWFWVQADRFLGWGRIILVIPSCPGN